MTPEELLAEALKQSRKILFGKTIGTDADGNCTVQSEDGSVLARSGGQISAGDCVALKADDGQWYAVSARQTGTVQRSALYKRRSRPIDSSISVGRVLIAYWKRVTRLINNVQKTVINIYLTGDRLEPELIHTEEDSRYVVNGFRVVKTSEEVGEYILTFLLIPSLEGAVSGGLKASKFCVIVNGEYKETVLEVVTDLFGDSQQKFVGAFSVSTTTAFFSDCFYTSLTSTLDEENEIFTTTATFRTYFVDPIEDVVGPSKTETLTYSTGAKIINKGTADEDLVFLGTPTARTTDTIEFNYSPTGITEIKIALGYDPINKTVLPQIQVFSYNLALDRERALIGKGIFYPTDLDNGVYFYGADGNATKLLNSYTDPSGILVNEFIALPVGVLKNPDGGIDEGGFFAFVTGVLTDTEIEYNGDFRFDRYFYSYTGFTDEDFASPQSNLNLSSQGAASVFWQGEESEEL